VSFYLGSLFCEKDTVQNVLGIASNIPGPVGVGIGVVELFLQKIANLFISNCSGPVVIDHVRYTNDTLANLQIGKPQCETKSYQLKSKGACDPSDYSYSYCFERLNGPFSEGGTNYSSTFRSSGE
jgi:hypothetical protein